MRGRTCRARGDYTTKQTTEQGVGVWFGPAGTSFYLWARQTVTGPNHSMGWLYRDETTMQLSPVWMTSLSRDHTTLAAAQTKRIRVIALHYTKSRSRPIYSAGQELPDVLRQQLASARRHPPNPTNPGQRRIIGTLLALARIWSISEQRALALLTRRLPVHAVAQRVAGREDRSPAARTVGVRRKAS